jgi:pyruvate/2-oxoglutarate dehydrogenase complex dihydrolipoamide dehydrogenase (E3) component
MRARRARIAPNDSQERFESLGVDVFRGNACFVSPREIVVNGQKLRAKNFVIATGSRAMIPKIEEIESVPYFTNETIFDALKEKPESMIVLGGGPIGCELGQAFSRLGVKITIVQNRNQLLPQEDSDVAVFLKKRLTAEGVDVRLNATIKRAGWENGRVVLQINEAEVKGGALLVAAGRTPNIEDLNLAVAGVKYNEHGVEVNAYLQSSQPHIYAAGDIANRLKFTHTADFTARIVVRNILMPFQFLRQKIDCAIVPWCTYTDPEVAHVGVRRKGKRSKKTPHTICSSYRWKMSIVL